MSKRVLLLCVCVQCVYVCLCVCVVLSSMFVHHVAVQMCIYSCCTVASQPLNPSTCLSACVYTCVWHQVEQSIQEVSESNAILERENTSVREMIAQAEDESAQMEDSAQELLSEKRRHSDRVTCVASCSAVWGYCGAVWSDVM